MNKNKPTDGTNVTPDKLSAASSNAISKVEEVNSIKHVDAVLELVDTMNQVSDNQDAPLATKGNAIIRCVTKTIEDVATGSKQLVKSTFPESHHPPTQPKK